MITSANAIFTGVWLSNYKITLRLSEVKAKIAEHSQLFSPQILCVIELKFQSLNSDYYD